jgi:hypothetical protein
MKIPQSTTFATVKTEHIESPVYTEATDIEDINSVFESLFRAAREESFEDGMDSHFSTRLMEIVQFNEANTEALIQVIVEKLNEEFSPDVISEALGTLGRINYPPTHTRRLWILAHSLNAKSAHVRDSAALGLASMDDPSALPYLQQAIDAEPIADLKQDMMQVLEQLQNTALEKTM